MTKPLLPSRSTSVVHFYFLRQAIVQELFLFSVFRLHYDLLSRIVGESQWADDTVTQQDKTAQCEIDP